MSDQRWAKIAKEISQVMLLGFPFGRTTSDILGLVVTINSSQRDMDKQVEEAVQALTKSSELMSNLENSLTERAEKLSELKEEYERVSALAEITEKEGEAITKQLEMIVGNNRTRDRWMSFLINITAGLIIFVLGIFASDWIKTLPEIFDSGSGDATAVETKVQEEGD